MKKKQNPFVATILKKLEPHGPITARAMFGGYGIYYDKVIFASIFMDRLYFRVDDYNQDDYARYDSVPFVYEGAGKIITLPYRSLPDEILDDPDLLSEWIHKAIEASLRHRKKKKKKVRLDDF